MFDFSPPLTHRCQENRSFFRALIFFQSREKGVKHYTEKRSALGNNLAKKQGVFGKNPVDKSPSEKRVPAYQVSYLCSTFSTPFASIPLLSSKRALKSDRTPARVITRTLTRIIIKLGTGTAYTGSSKLLAVGNLLTDPASTFASSSYLTHAQKTRHIIVWKSAKIVPGGDRRDSKYTAAIQYTVWQ